MPHYTYSSEEISHALLSVQKFLTPQGPLDSLVHFNTLQGFETVNFDKAVRQLAEIKGTNAYMDHSLYRMAAASGRIDDDALRSVFAQIPSLIPAFPSGGETDSFTVFKALLLLPDHKETSASIKWALHYDLPSTLRPRHRAWFKQKITTLLMHQHFDQLAALYHAPDPVFGLNLPYTHASYWQNLASVEDIKNMGEALVIYWWKTIYSAIFALSSTHLEAHNKLPNRATRINFASQPLERANQISYNFLAAYFDKGISSWPLDKESEGLVATFLRSIVQADLRLPSAVSLFDKERALYLFSLSPDQLLGNLLALYQLPLAHLEILLFGLLADVQGWGGLLCFYERFKRGGRFADLITMRLVIFHLLGLDKHPQLVFSSAHKNPLEHTYAALRLVLSLDLRTSHLDGLMTHSADALYQLLERFDGSEKCRYLQIAYESTYYSRIARALRARHQRCKGQTPRKIKATSTAIFCLDEREESIRRHIEEIDPRCATDSFAGFFNIDMRYSKAREQTARDQCPIVVTPQKLIAEQVVSHSSGKHRLRRMIAHTRRMLYRKTSSLAVGALLHLSVLVFTLFGDVLRFLTPRLFSRFNEALRHWLEDHQITRLAVKNTAEGFTSEEIVQRLAVVLKTIGLDQRFTTLVFLFGHGSTSRNNPHSSGYDCGACGAKQGGPNARAFAAMANDQEIRGLLKEKGIVIPADTWFIGGFHNTCSDTLDYFDTDLIPLSHRGAFALQRSLFHEACKRNAAERARRFINVPFKDLEETYLRVQTRANKYAQPRPECGHATNATCIVGSRELSKGVFLDRRSFLCSYNGEGDPDGSLLAQILGAAVPVCSGINLEYYFSYIDNEGLGSGSKLSHNITSLVGVVNGGTGDLKTGLPRQMVEIHEPLRLLFIIDASREKLLSLQGKIPHVFTLVAQKWIYFALWDGTSGTLSYLDGSEIPLHHNDVPWAKNSAAYYKQERDHLIPGLLGEAY